MTDTNVFRLSHPGSFADSLTAHRCAANHDERRYDAADTLDVRRRDVKPLSFGGGTHYCIGAALARIEAKAAFERLVSRTRELALAERPEWRPGINLRALTRLPIALAS